MIDRLRHWISMTDPKYLPIMVLPAVVVYLAAGPSRPWLLLAACAAVVLLNTAAVLVNMYADRRADQVNFPEGVEALERHIGYRRLLFLILLCYLGLAAASVAFWGGVSPDAGALYTAGWLIATFYSVILRLKRNLILSRLAIACGPPFSFAGGWVLQGRSLRELPAAAFLLFVGQGIHILLKDVPDADGDRRMGVRTLFTRFSPDQLRIFLPALWMVPYLLASLGTQLDWWPQRYHGLWGFYPLALIVIAAALQARDQQERELVRELAQLFSTLFVLGNLLLFSPDAATAWICTGAVGYYLLVLTLGIDRRRQGHGLADLLVFAGRTVRQSLGLSLPRQQKGFEDGQ